ncbi:MAG: hypothetical protein WCW27_02380 [Patescibacteria group bacterium]|jgi:hypothetical protein
MWYFLGLPVYGEHATQSIYYTDLIGNNFITGGWFGIDASIIMIILLIILFVIFDPRKIFGKIKIVKLKNYNAISNKFF